MCLPYLHMATSVPSFQRMDARGTVSRDWVTSAHANGDREIWLLNLSREGGELDIRMPNKTTCEGTHHWRPQREGHLRIWREYGQAKDTSQEGIVRERKRVSDRGHLRALDSRSLTL